MKKSKGLVSLVGAGPGDPGLLTLRARQRLTEADLVVYDTLANPRHLVHAPNAKTIAVGEGFRHHPISQSQIYKQMVSVARRGGRVVRLKGGDPCLFGRGGEEALFFAKRGLPFEIVPGVTSATAVAAYAGVPLTHRDHNATVTFVTGHRAHDKKLDSIDWKKIADLRGTLVVYMGFYNLNVIAEHLLRAGLPSATPAMVVEWGTLGRQKSVSGNLSAIHRLARQKKLAPPCLIIVGEVVRLRARLNWFENLPLFGMKIVVTRPGGSCDRLASKLGQLGAEIIELPVIAVEEPSSWKAVDEAIRQLSRFQWIVFASSAGVRFFMKRLFSKKNIDARFFSPLKIAAVGPETARALEAYGLKADAVPAQFNAASLMKIIQPADSSVLLVRTSLADDKLDKAFSRRFPHVHRVNAYQTIMAASVPEKARRLILRGEADIVTFTSASAVNAFIRLIGRKSAARLARRTRWASIGPATSEALRRQGLRPWREASPHTFQGLVEAIRSR